MNDMNHDNLRKLPGAKKALTSLEISMELSRIARGLSSHRARLEPTAFVLILINHGKMEFDIQGFEDWELYAEAEKVLEDFRHHRQFPAIHRSPHDMRRWRRTYQRRQAKARLADTAAHPYRCAYCPRRFEKKRGWQQHEVFCRDRHPQQPARRIEPEGEVETSVRPLLEVIRGGK